MNSVLADANENQQLKRAPVDEVVGRPSSSYSQSGGEDADIEIDLKGLFDVLVRRKATILLIAVLTTVAALVITLMTQPIYRANTTIQISPETKVLRYDVEANGGESTSRGFYQTQFEILKSRALAERTADSLGGGKVLSGDKLAKPFFSGTIDSFKSLLFGNKTEEMSDDELDEAEIESKPVQTRMLGNLSVMPVGSSQIVRLSYDSPNPQIAARVVNAFAANYIELNLERRVGSASFAKKFLTKQLLDVKSRLEESQYNLNNYAKEKGLFKIDDEGTKSLTAAKVLHLSSVIGEAETKRIEAQIRYEQGQFIKGNAKLLESSTIETLRTSLIKLEAKYQEQLQIYKPSYPLMVQLRRQMAKISENVETETQLVKETIQQSLKADFLAAKDNEARLLEQFEISKIKLIEMRDKDIGYGTLLREVETSRSSYDGLLTRLKEVNVAGGIESDNISVLDHAVAPSVKHKPNNRRNITIGVLMGLLFGIAMAFLLEFLDDRVKTTDQLERLLGLPLLGMTPSVKGDDPIVHALMTMQQPTSAIAESFRSFRTNLLFASREGTPKVITLTSAMPSEGKSSSCMNLAIAFAQSNSRVLVVDADLRKPTAHKRLKLDNSKGLSNYLTYQADLDDVIQETLIPGVSAITAGPLSPNPSELLSSERLLDLFKLAPDTFDLIIIDSPPVMGLADALVLANRASATIMVCGFAQSKKRQIQDAHRRLKQAQANIIGVLFTKVKTGGSYGGYNYNYEYYYSYGNDRIAEKASA